MGRAVLVPIGVGQGGDLVAVGEPVSVDGGGGANDVVATAEAAGAVHLIAFPAVEPDPAADAERAVERAVEAVAALPGRIGLVCIDNDPPILAVSVAALSAVGGFDPDQPGLGWLDLVDRLHRSGWPVLGFDPADLPFVPALTAGLDTADRVMSEGRWLTANADGRAGRRRLERYHRAVLAAVSDLRRVGGDDGGILDRVETEAERRWRGLRPDEAQLGVGRRADWRHLLPERAGAGPRRLVVLSGLGPIDDWQWLVDDGWTERVDDRLPDAPTADVIVLGPAPVAELEVRVGAAVAALAGGGTLCAMVGGGRRPASVGGSRRVVGRLRKAGYVTVRRHLALPDATRAKRYLPLDHPGGLAWLAGPPPALEAAALPRSRRRLRDLVGRVGGLAPELVGDVVVVASAEPAARWDQAVVLTSGFDEGSRTVLLPLTDDDGPAPTPTAVVKVAARPGYEANGRREHQLLVDLAARVEPPGLVPEPGDPVERDGLPATVESYAGRWTASDILNEQSSVAARAELLDALLTAVTDLNRTGASFERWDDTEFEALVGRWFDRLDRLEGPSPARAALRARLHERSGRLEGALLPVGLRHYDLGPWNILLADATSGAGGRSPITVVDWELTPPRDRAFGPIGCDQLYLCKYWLHIASDCRSVEEEQSAFAFLADGTDPSGGRGGRGGSGRLGRSARSGDDARRLARSALMAVAARVDLPLGFLPILEAHVWAEAACFTNERRRGQEGDGGSPARYLATLARRRTELLAAWA